MPTQIHLLSTFQFIRATLLCWTLVMKQNIYTSKETTMFHSSRLVYLQRWSRYLTERLRKGTRIGRPIHPCLHPDYLVARVTPYLPWIEPPAPELLSTCGPTDQSQLSLLRPRPLIGGEQWLRRVLLAYLAILSQ